MNYTVKIWRKSCGNSQRGTNFGTLLNEGTKCFSEHLGYGTIVNEYGNLQAASYEVYNNVSLQELHAAIKKNRIMVVYAQGAYEANEPPICSVGYEKLEDAGACIRMNKLVDAMASLAAVWYPIVSDGLYYVQAPDWQNAVATSSYSAAKKWIETRKHLVPSEARVFSIVNAK